MTTDKETPYWSQSLFFQGFIQAMMPGLYETAAIAAFALLILWALMRETK